MPPHNPAFDFNGASSDDGAVVLVFDTLPTDFPPKQRKIDPSTIWWPEGEAKPWEKNQPPEGPSKAEGDSTAP